MNLIDEVTLKGKILMKIGDGGDEFDRGWVGGVSAMLRLIHGEMRPCNNEKCAVTLFDSTISNILMQLIKTEFDLEKANEALITVAAVNRGEASKIARKALGWAIK